ncbi:MAG: PTS sugar transporter subunit IIA [Pirellulaceae bacterium]|nr:PTS sugar transporter subunit IIA [Planctomycetales bacterium]
MSEFEDFDLASLAAYLHLTPQQVERLANRGQVPGRKVGGKWRFSRAEIHHWMEDRIGLLDEDELQQVEGALDRAASIEDPIVSIAELMPVEAICMELQSRSRNKVISEMSQLAAQTGYLWDAEEMADAVRAREEMQSTALPGGVALLHPRRPLPRILGSALVALGRSGGGIHFGEQGQLTDLFFLIASVTDRGHLRTLARLSRLVSSPDFLPALRQATSPREVHEFVAAAESALDVGGRST